MEGRWLLAGAALLMLLAPANAAPADAELRLAPPLHFGGDVRVEAREGVALLPPLHALDARGTMLNITLHRNGPRDAHPSSHGALLPIPPAPEPLLPPLHPEPADVRYLTMVDPEGLMFTTWQAGARAVVAVGPFDEGRIAIQGDLATVREGQVERAGPLPDLFAPRGEAVWLDTAMAGRLAVDGTVRALFEGVALVVRNATHDLPVDTRRDPDGSGWVADLRWTDARFVAAAEKPLMLLAPRLRFDVDGSLEAAQAWGAVAVDAVEEQGNGRPIRAQGAMAGTMAPGGGSVRLRAAGDLASLVLGETGTDYTRAAVAGAGVALASALLYYGQNLRFLVVPLYARVAPSEVLDNEVRRKVHAHVTQHPGADVKTTALAVGVSWSTGAYHLARLQREGLVLARRSGRSKRFFVNGAGVSGRADAIAALRNPTAMAIAELVARQPGLMQKEIGATLALPPSTVSWHMRRLRALGVVQEERRWRRAEYAPGALWHELATALRGPPLA
jgi:DNA-binding transcriptional ArsR family regulator